MYKFTNSEMLPDSWELTTLSTIAAINPPTDISQFDDNILVPFVPMPLVEELTGKLDSSRLEKLGKVKKGYTRFQEGDVLFAKITPCMENGKVAIAENLKGGIGTGSTEFHVLRARDKISNQYILYYLLQNAFRGDAQHHMTGMVGQKRVPSKYIEDSEIPIPPSTEQQRIVSKIEELFSDLDEGEVNLRNVQKLLARYRQSVLKAAVTGELTKDWREANKHRLEPGAALLKRILQTRREQWQGRGQYQELSAPDTTSLPKLPDGWGWASPEQVCNIIVDCPHSTPKWTKEGIICVRTTEFLPGKLKLDDVRYVSESTYQERIARLEPLAGDILYSREGGILGIACIVPEGTKLCMGQRMMLMRACISGEYLMHVLNSPLILSLVSLKTSGSASPHLNVRDIKLFPIPFPSKEEQLEIVSRIDDTFSQISALETWCQTELARSGSLRQSILKTAFSGKLVPQDPMDEPASELLKRIQDEREQQPAGHQTQRGKRKRQPTLWEAA